MKNVLERIFNDQTSLQIEGWLKTNDTFLKSVRSSRRDIAFIS